MRKHRYIYFILALLSDCSSAPDDTPESVVKQFAQALEDKDYDKLKSLCTEETRGLVEVYKLTGPLLTTQTNELDKNEATCRVEGDEATCLNCCLNDGTKRQYDLLKENGQWKVKFTLSFATGSDSTLQNSMEPIEPEVEPVEDAIKNP